MTRRMNRPTYFVGALLAGGVVGVSACLRDASPPSAWPAPETAREPDAAAQADELPAVELAAIRERVAEVVPGEPILRIFVDADGVYVTTGVRKGGLCGWGHFVALRKGADGWEVEEIVEWMS